MYHDTEIKRYSKRVIQVNSKKGGIKLKNKLYFIISALVIFSSILTLLFMVNGVKDIITCAFFIYLFLLLFLIFNLSSYVTAFWYVREKSKKHFIMGAIFLVVNVLFILLHLYIVTLLYLFN